MAAGKPIVFLEGSAKNLEHGKTGWVVENGDICAFAKAIPLLLEDSTLTQILGENAKRHVSSEYTWKETALKTELIYEHILGEKLK
jgi:glycosyltransferase involved in cell wall biosynthesis